jgi:hypothetical protein
MNKVDTISLKGNDYALVPARLKAFREANPRASVDTEPTVQADGTVIYKATIIADQSKEDSPKATGHAYGKIVGGEAKAFEKLETNAVGRALALLGYLNNGQIATTEEMAEYEEYKEERWLEVVGEIHSATKREEFQTIMAGLNAEQKKAATPLINQRIKELQNVKATTSTSA